MGRGISTAEILLHELQLGNLPSSPLLNPHPARVRSSSETGSKTLEPDGRLLPGETGSKSLSICMTQFPSLLNEGRNSTGLVRLLNG